MPTPIPDTVTEAWLIPATFIRMANQGSSGWWRDGDYVNIPIERRNDSAKALYEYLTDEQVVELRTQGEFIEGDYKIKCSSRGSTSDHPGVARVGGFSVRCVSYGDEDSSHALLPICDRLLALLLAVRCKALPPDLKYS